MWKDVCTQIYTQTHRAFATNTGILTPRSQVPAVCQLQLDLLVMRASSERKKKRDSWRKRLETAVYLQSCEPGESVHAGTTPAKGLIVSGEAKVSLLLLLDIFVLVRAQKLARQCSE